MEKEIITFESVKNIGLNYPRGRQDFESTYLTEYVKLANFLSNKKLKNGFIEIGSAWGASFHLIASYIEGIKISVDIPFEQNSGFAPWPPGLTLDALEERLKIWQSHFDNVHQVIGNSHDAGTIQSVEKIISSPVSFLYIDADHSRKAAELDFNNYKQFVEKGGYIGFHDIQLGDPYYLTDMWSELKQQYVYEELLGENECIGIIQV